MEDNIALVNADPQNIAIASETASLIKASIAENTQKAYQRTLNDLTNWLSGRTLSDQLLANYITTLHKVGKSPAIIGQAVAAVKWQFKYQLQETLNSPVMQVTFESP